MIYVFEPSSTLIFRSGFCKSICSYTCSTLIFKTSFYKSTYFFTCYTLIFKYGFCRTTCGVGASPSTCSTLIFSSSFYRFSFRPIFCMKSFRLDLFSSTLTSRFVAFNTTSLEPKNFEQSCICSTLARRNDILRKHCKDWTNVLISTYV
jgi:hypothetical protein